MDWFGRSQMCAHTDILEDFFFFLNYFALFYPFSSDQQMSQTNDLLET